MNEKIIKWGFIGCGEVTKYKSGPAFQKIEHSEVVAVMSRDISKAKAYAKERGIAKWYNDAQELINDEEVNALSKMQRKNLDMIVLNSLNDKGAGFSVDTNKVTILDKAGDKTVYELKTKVEVAKDIVDQIAFRL